MKIKAYQLNEDYENETNFFLDILESLIDKDFDLESGIKIIRKASKYYVSDYYFNLLINIMDPEIKALTNIHKNIKVLRRKI